MLKDIVVALVALVGAVTAVYGLSTWRRQLKGGAEYAAARQLLLAIYRFRDVFNSVRSPGMWLTEPEASEQPQKGATSPLQRAFGERIDKLQESWSQVQLATQEAEVLWGPVVSEPIQELNSCRAKHMGSIWEYLWLHGGAPAYATVDRNPERLDRVQREVFAVSADPAADPVLQRVTQAVAAAERILRPRIHR
jgi:hypothetical protein